MDQPCTPDDIVSGEYDFLDLGASKGASLALGTSKLGGTLGVGVDIAPEKVEAARAKGLRCIQGDATCLDLPVNAVRFVIMSHFLEHLPNHEVVRSVIRDSARVASDFLFIQGPFYDANDYLDSLGLKLFSSDWSVHTCHLQVSTLTQILHEESLLDFKLFVVQPIVHSDHTHIHPRSSPPNQHAYAPEKHPPKKAVPFTVPIFREFVCIIKLREFDDWDRVLRVKQGAIPYDFPPTRPEREF